MGTSEKGSERIQYVIPNQIVRIDTTPENLEIINDWIIGLDVPFARSNLPAMHHHTPSILTRTPSPEAHQHFLLKGIAEPPFDGRLFGILTSACENPMCRCQEIYLYGFPEARMESTNCTFAVRADLGTHQVLAISSGTSQANEADATLLGEYLSPDDWAALASTWRGIKAAQIEEVTPEKAAELDFDFPSEPSKMVIFMDVFPQCRPLNIAHGGQMLQAMDFYCTDPHCECTNIVLTCLRGVEKDKTNFSLGYNYQTGRLVRAQTTELPIAEAAALVKQMNEEWPEMNACLAHRNKVLRAMRLKYMRIKKPLRVERLLQGRGASIGRNAPCSCGSGKKYKHCCGK